MLIIGNVTLDTMAIVSMVLRAATNTYILTGLACCVLSFGVWLIVLSKVEASLAYPMLSIGYVVTAIIGCCFMGESASVNKVLGIITICIGTGLLFNA